jgi:hypothetical protein
LGNEPKARGYLERIVQTCKDSAYEKEACAWLEKEKAAEGSSTPLGIGCHTNQAKPVGRRNAAAPDDRSGAACRTAIATGSRL